MGNVAKGKASGCRRGRRWLPTGRLERAHRGAERVSVRRGVRMVDGRVVGEGKLQTCVGHRRVCRNYRLRITRMRSSLVVRVPRLERRSSGMRSS